MSGLLRLLRRWFPGTLAGPWTIPEDRGEFPVFLLMGQSNMAGHGCVRPGDPRRKGDRRPVPGVMVFGGQGTIKCPRPRGWTRWRPAAHPLHLNQGSAGFGLGLPFAVQLLEDTHATRVGLVPAAWGGAGIDALGPGTPLWKPSSAAPRSGPACGKWRKRIPTRPSSKAKASPAATMSISTAPR